jgi:hypothetical protein
VVRRDADGELTLFKAALDVIQHFGLNWSHHTTLNPSGKSFINSPHADVQTLTTTEITLVQPEAGFDRPRCPVAGEAIADSAGARGKRTNSQGDKKESDHDSFA